MLTCTEPFALRSRYGTRNLRDLDDAGCHFRFGLVGEF
jgi:hypothetical protein